MTAEFDLVRLREVAEAALPWSAKRIISGPGSYYLGLMAEDAETKFTAEWTPEIAVAVLDRLAEAEAVIANIGKYADDRAFHARGHLNTVNSGRIASDLHSILSAYTKGTEQQ